MTKRIIRSYAAEFKQEAVALVCPPIRHQLTRVQALMNWIADHFNERYQQILQG